MADDLLARFDELCTLESERLTRVLSKPEHERWCALQKLLMPALCDFTTSAQERRETLRLPCPLGVVIVSGDTTFEGTAIDVSAGGVGVRANLLPALGERLTLVCAEEPAGTRFVLGLEGHVVWLRKLTHPLGAGFGIAFGGETESQRRHLAQLLLFLLRKQRPKLDRA